MTNIKSIIKYHKMISHPEGGYYVEVFKNKHISHIYFLLEGHQYSHWHRITKNETLHFYSGSPLKIYTSEDGDTTIIEDIPSKFVTYPVIDKKKLKENAFNTNWGKNNSLNINPKNLIWKQSEGNKKSEQSLKAFLKSPLRGVSRKKKAENLVENLEENLVKKREVNPKNPKNNY